jgi:hypothetical protein
MLRYAFLLTQGALRILIGVYRAYPSFGQHIEEAEQDMKIE